MRRSSERLRLYRKLNGDIRRFTESNISHNSHADLGESLATDENYEGQILPSKRLTFDH
ncbi:hypothetical protein Poly59_07770 [Rubripirellula reticaptiva]|uniref:Uncharacterized protein n=1 Tax=Rubripirellula reticaptiva TaxID=2528013 RepID=A0A5C6F8Z9_9BACT|nr:hypothetical protein Poly59_07770 [Rubripirellula reticaptiva]